MFLLISIICTTSYGALNQSVVCYIVINNTVYGDSSWGLQKKCRFFQLWWTHEWRVINFRILQQIICCESYRWQSWCWTRPREDVEGKLTGPWQGCGGVGLSWWGCHGGPRPREDVEGEEWLAHGRGWEVCRSYAVVVPGPGRMWKWRSHKWDQSMRCFPSTLGLRWRQVLYRVNRPYTELTTRRGPIFKTLPLSNSNSSLINLLGCQ